MRLSVNIPRTKVLLFVASVMIIQFSCKKDKELGITNDNNAPACTITSPNDGDEFMQGDTVFISADAYDTDGFITEVGFYFDNALIFLDVDSPYMYEFYTLNLEAGNYPVSVEAEDDDSTTKSDQISISIAVPEPPAPPANFGCTGTCMTYHYSSGILSYVIVYFQWDSSPNSTGYNIYSSSTSGQYPINPALTTTNTGGSKNYSVGASSYNRYLIVRAFNDDGLSGPSNEYVVTIPARN